MTRILIKFKRNYAVKNKVFNTITVTIENAYVIKEGGMQRRVCCDAIPCDVSLLSMCNSSTIMWGRFQVLMESQQN